MDAQGKIGGRWGVEPVGEGLKPFADMTNTVSGQPNWLRQMAIEENASEDCGLAAGSIDSLSLQMQFTGLTPGLRNPFNSQQPPEAYPHMAAVSKAMGCSEDGSLPAFDAHGVLQGDLFNYVENSVQVQATRAAADHEDFNLWQSNAMGSSPLTALGISRGGSLDLVGQGVACVPHHGSFSEEALSSSMLGMVPAKDLIADKKWARDLLMLTNHGATGLDGEGIHSVEIHDTCKALRKSGGSVDTPSGPRKSGQGTEDSIQSIVAIDKVAGDCIVVNVTLLVSGFIIGPKGASIREIQKKTRSQIRSFNKRPSITCPRILRTFSIQGTQTAQAHAVDIIKAAVARYKYLAEGPCNGQRVSHVHAIFGIDFFYSPPPKSIVPHAAGLDPLEDCGLRGKPAVTGLQEILKHGLH